MSLSLRCTLVVALAFAAPLALEGPALAQDPIAEADGPEEEQQLPVSVRVRVGYGQKMSSVGFAPVFVDLTAHESDQVVSLKFLGGPQGQTELLKLGPVTLTKGQPRRVRGLAPSRTWFDSGAAELVVLDTDGAVVGQADILAEQSANRRLLVIDRHGAPPTDFSALESQRTNRARHKNRKKTAQWDSAILSEREELPLSPLGYTSLHAVLLGDLELERWSDEQAEALAGWVAQGGCLFLSIGKRGTLLRQSLLGRRLGEALAPIPFDRQPLVGKDVSLGTLLGTLGPIEADTVIRPPYSSPLVPGVADEVPYRDDAGRPFVVRRRHGDGSVTLIASDLWSPPFLHSKHVKRLVEDQLGDVRYSYHPPGKSQQLFHELASVRQPAQVGPAFALLIIFALVAGPGIYFLLREKKRGILLWVAIPALTIGFTALVPFFRLVLKDAESTLVGIRLLTAQSGDVLTVETIDVLIFSGGLEKKTFTLSGDSATAISVLPPKRIRSRGALRPGAVLGGPGPGDLAFELPIALWGTRYVSFARTGKERAVTGSVSLRLPTRGDIGLPRVDLNYSGTFPLKNAIVLFPSKVGALIHELDSDLSPGTPYSHKVLDVSQASTFESPDRTLGGLLVTRLVTDYRSWSETQRKAFLIGHTHAPLPVKAEPNVRVRASTTIVVVELPLEYLDGVPMSLASPSSSASTIATVNTATVTRELRTKIRFPNGASRQATQLSARLMAPRGSILTDDSMRLFGIAHGPNGATREAIALNPEHVTRDNTGRVLVLELQDPARWLSPEGYVELIQVFDRPRVELDTRYSATIDASVRWSEEPR